LFFFLKTLFHFAAATKFQDSNIIQHLLSKLNPSLINTQNLKKQSPLHIAVLHNNPNAVHQLLTAGISIKISFFSPYSSIVV
jgi:ankyrin repeat protein